MKSGIIFITFLVLFSVSFVASQEVKCEAKCVCPRIYMPVCNSAGMKLADNDCIANCYREKCGMFKEDNFVPCEHHWEEGTL